MEKTDQENLNLIEEALNQSRPITAQAFDSRIHEGEIRVFTAFGEAIEWSLKIPKKGQFLANTAAGAVIRPYHPPESLLKAVEAVAKTLLDDKIYFIGFDIIGDEITEINITSPRLLSETLAIEPFIKIASLIEKDLSP